MAIDIQQFHQTFFDESQEGLVSMESALLKIEQGLSASLPNQAAATDPEVLNTIFRVVHSIKGGASTFGFGWVADFSHLLETLLDDVRTGSRRVDQHTAGLLLRSVDCLQILLANARSGKAVNAAAIEEVNAELESLHLSPTRASNVGAAVADTGGSRAWRIRFLPKPGLFFSGNDPLRILRELSALGELRIETDLTRLPSWSALDPEACYLGWMLELSGIVTREAIAEVFSWVTEECELEVVPIPDRLSTDEIANAAPRGADDDHAKLRGTSIRVSTTKMDTLVDIVGELVITQTILNQTVAQFGPDSLQQLNAGMAQLERNLRQLQENVMRIRMLPIGFVFNRLPRLVRDISQQLGKQVELKVSGEGTELDKTVIERISDPLLHMVRNSLDHGIETPQERLAAGKPETACIRIDASQRGGHVIVEIEDDGRGLDQDKILQRAIERGLVPATAKLSAEQIAELVFLPGFTTADSVSDLSGRGVGLDVVRSNIHSLGGNIDVRSLAGRGTHFIIRLPLTLAILDGLGVQVGAQTYILPLTSITESMALAQDHIRRLPGGEEIFQFRNEYVPLIRLCRVFGGAPGGDDSNTGIVVVVEANGRRAGLLVDDLLGQQQIVIKSLESHYRRVDGISAATILGDGTVALILDIGGLVCAVAAPILNLSSTQPTALSWPSSQPSAPVRALH